MSSIKLINNIATKVAPTIIIKHDTIMRKYDSDSII